MPCKSESDLVFSYLSSLSQVSMPLKKLGSVEEKIRPVGNCDNVAKWQGKGGGIPHICHESHENYRVNFFWPL